MPAQRVVYEEIVAGVARRVRRAAFVMLFPEWTRSCQRSIVNAANVEPRPYSVERHTAILKVYGIGGSIIRSFVR